MQLKEFAFKVNQQLANHSADEIRRSAEWLRCGKKLIVFKDEQYSIYRRENNFGLFKNAEFIGFIVLGQENSEFVELQKIYILEEFRNKKIAKMFLFWLKVAIGKSIFIGGAIFRDGENLIKSIENDSRFSVVGVNSKTLDRNEFSYSWLFKNKYNGLLVEYDSKDGFFENNIPGVSSNIQQLNLF